MSKVVTMKRLVYVTLVAVIITGVHIAEYNHGLNDTREERTEYYGPGY